MRARAHMSLDTARKVFARIGSYVGRRDAAPHGYAQVNKMVFLHVMGEPLLHPHLSEIAHIVHDANLVPALLTNVTLLDDQNTRRVLESDFGHVTLSVNTATDADFAALGGRESQGQQERRVLSFLRARAAHPHRVPHVDIQYLLKTHSAVAGPALLGTKEDVWEIYRHWLYLMRSTDEALFQSVDVRPYVDSRKLMHPSAVFGEDPSARFALEPGIDLVVKGACTFGNVALSPGYMVHSTEQGRCPYYNPFRQMAVFVDGSVSFCNLDHENSVNIGSLLMDDVHTLWASQRMQRIREAMLHNRLSEPLCQRCMGTVTLAPPRAPARANE
jgi:hypothetical protein